MKKREIVLTILLLAIVFVVVSSENVVAADNQTIIDNALKCINEEIGNKSTLTLEQAIFASMILGSNEKAENKISSDKDPQECWPKGGCQIKESAQVTLALQKKGSDTSKVTKWILSKNSTPSELAWYLQIDIQDHSPAKCTVEYDSKSGDVEILEDMTLSRNTASDCLSIAGKGYWLKIAPSCVSKKFKVACNKDFLTSLLYQKNNGETVYVSSESHKASSNSTTVEEVKARCFAKGNTCDYEGTLWAAFALNKAGLDVQIYLPYLIALAEDNTRYLPSAFLYGLLGKDAGSDEFYNDLIQKQKRDGFWEITGSRYGKYYDSGVAMFGLGGKEIAEVEKFKEALAKEQNSRGCWAAVDPIRDTSFILYSVWNQMVRRGGGSGSGGGSDPRCEFKSGQSCEVRADCVGAGAQEVPGFLCAAGKICCSEEVVLKTCAQQNGIVCAADEQCDESVVTSSDGSCCLGRCEKIPPVADLDTCTVRGGECASSCSSNQKEDQSKTCSVTGEICCIADKKSNGPNWGLIIALIILIALVVLAIIYRDKLRVWWYSRKGKVSSSAIVRPGVPPMGGEPRPGPQLGLRPQQKFISSNRMPPARPAIRPVSQGGSQRKPVSQKDKDLEETLKKLKEMSE
ncbi:MAG: hypothetical protein Q8Q31_01920 [Nanoarchaeota archaeon]|nr:hypothetical protein [Nanoarchaeota archaeon]